MRIKLSYIDLVPVDYQSGNRTFKKDLSHTMKVRIQGNSIRFRLTRSEVEQLAAKGQVVATTHFKNSTFTYRLLLDADIDKLSATFEANCLTIKLACAQGKSWADSEQVGFEMMADNGQHDKLHLLVEKDFVCLDRDPTLQKDQYPNPKMIGND